MFGGVMVIEPLKRIASVFIAVCLFAALVLATQASGEGSDKPCEAGTERLTVTVGIVQADACWTYNSTKTLYQAEFDQQGSYGIDLNGFILTGKAGGALTVNKENREFKTVALDGQPGSDKAKVQLNSYDMPKSGANTPIGDPILLDFIAPNVGPLVIEDLRLGSNNAWTKVLAGFSPVGTVETPVQLEEDGKGSMDFTVMLAGIFTLKGKDQSVTVKLPTEIGKGTRLDGFKINLKEIDGLKVVNLEDFEAEYSASEHILGGEATVVLPFMGSPKGENGKGMSGGFKLENGKLTHLGLGVSGLEIPIGTPPGGFITAISGGMDISDATQTATINAALSATLGKEVKLPWGNVAPVDLDAAVKVGTQGGGFYFRFDGGLKLFRIPVGNAYLIIQSNAGMAIGLSLGLGVPSFSNNNNDPFYVGAYVNGWIGKGMWQFSGGAQIKALNIDLIRGDLMVNNKAIGACWTIIFRGGIVFPYGGSLTAFPFNTCGLGAYEEKNPFGGTPKTARSMPIHLERDEKLLRIRGDGGIPRFDLHAADGRQIKGPVGDEVKRTRNWAVLLDKKDTAFVMLRHPAGRWTLEPRIGSPRITAVHSNRVLPRPRVRAKVVGKGLWRTLVWNSTGHPNTELVFTEKTRTGSEHPVLKTRKAKGRFRFKAVNGFGYGVRRLKVLVLHGHGPMLNKVVDRFVVKRPGKLRAPRWVRAGRNVHDVTVRWAGVRGASGYLAQVVIRKRNRAQTSFVRRFGPKARQWTLRHHPGGATAIARVYALNADGALGRARKTTFRTAPPKLNLRTAARRSAESTHREGGKVALRTICPEDGHCRTNVSLLVGNRKVRSVNFQQVPDTYSRVLLVPDSGSLRNRIARGLVKNLRVRVTISRFGRPASAARRS